MQLQEIKLSNFKSYKDEDLDLQDIYEATLSGPNGAGKSSLLTDGPLWALFGRLHADLDSVIGPYGDETKAEVVFANNGQKYKITRIRSGKGKSSLELTNGETVLTGDSIADTEAKIRDLFRMDYETLKASAWMVQGEHSSYTKATPATRKDVLCQILGLDVYEKLAEKAKDRIRLIEAEIEASKNRLETIKEQLTKKDEITAQAAEAKHEVERLTKEIEAAEAELKSLQKKKEDLAAKRAEWEALDREVKSLRDDVYKLQDELEGIGRKENELTELLGQKEDVEKQAKRYREVQSEVERLNEAQFEWDKWEIELDKIQQSLASFDTEAESLQENIDEINGKIRKIKESPKPVCDQCGSVLEGERHKQALTSLQHKLELAIQKSREQKEKAKKQAKEFKQLTGKEPKYESTKHAEMKRELSSLSGSEAKLARIEEAEKGMEELVQRKWRTEKEIDEKKAKGAEVKEKWQKAGKELEDHEEPALVQFDKKEHDLQWKRKDHQNATTSLARSQQTLEHLSDLEGEASETETKTEGKQKQSHLFSLLRQAFSRNGIPARIIDNSIPEIETQANSMLERMTDGRLWVRLDTQKEKKTGGIAETLEIFVDDGNGERTFETYSGGEGFRINFALRVGLSKLLAKRAGISFDQIVIDEPEGLDSEGRAQLIECINAIRDQFSKILLISHHEDLREALPQQIIVTKGESGSKAEIVA